MKYDKIGNWYRLLEDYTYETNINLPMPLMLPFAFITDTGVVTLHRGFCWDGASGAFDTDNVLAASAVHDFFCNLYNAKLIDKTLRKQADKLFKEHLKQSKVSKFRRSYMYAVVRRFFELFH